MRDISMERVNETREKILEIIESPVLTHEQKLTNLANQADSLMEVLDFGRVETRATRSYVLLT